MQKRQKAIGMSIIAISVIGVLIIALGVSPGWNMTWNAEEGDTLSFSVKGYFSYEFLNNTIITGNISTLPSIPSILTPLTFASSIIEMSKISVLFENGTDTGYYSYLLNRIISRTILPCGDWELLDSMYPSPESIPYSALGNPSSYVTQLEENYFVIGYVGYDFDSSNGWIANISLDTGIPSYIQYWRYDDFSQYTTGITGGSLREYQIVLELFQI